MASADAAEGQRAVSPFWTFSLRIYALPGVPAACLELQDGSGAAVDVNVILFALYCARMGRQLDPAAVRGMIGLVEDWRRSVVVSLRQARRALKQPGQAFATPEVAALRQRVKAAELEAERLQQEVLFASLPASSLGTPAAPAQAAQANLAAYEQVVGGRFDPAATAALLDAFHSLKD